MESVFVEHHRLPPRSPSEVQPSYVLPAATNGNWQGWPASTSTVTHATAGASFTGGDSTGIVAVAVAVGVGGAAGAEGGLLAGRWRRLVAPLRLSVHWQPEREFQLNERPQWTRHLLAERVDTLLDVLSLLVSPFSPFSPFSLFAAFLHLPFWRQNFSHSGSHPGSPSFTPHMPDPVSSSSSSSAWSVLVRLASTLVLVLRVLVSSVLLSSISANMRSKQWSLFSSSVSRMCPWAGSQRTTTRRHIAKPQSHFIFLIQAGAVSTYGCAALLFTSLATSKRS